MKRKTSKITISRKMKPLCLPHGVVVFKRCLEEKQQIKLLKICLDMSLQGGNEELLEKIPKRTTKAPLPLLFYNWPTRPRSMSEMEKPSELLELATGIFREAIRTIDKRKHETLHNPNNFRCPQTFLPDALYGILYPENGRFGAHVDGAKGWVLSISIGESANFFFSNGLEGHRTSIQIDSGDAVIFNGGMLVHGIDRVMPDTAPSFWDDHSVSLHHMKRFNLQFRDPKNDRLSYEPSFTEEGRENGLSLSDKEKLSHLIPDNPKEEVV